MNDNRDALIAETAGICAAYVSNNAVPVSDLGKVIQAVHAALSGLASGAAAAPAPEPEAIEKPTPAEIRKSITPDAIISFIDGKAYKTLKRHLGTHGLDPQSYRQRYGLDRTYPMVAPNYAKQRSALAKKIGLGKPGGQAARAA